MVACCLPPIQVVLPDGYLRDVTKRFALYRFAWNRALCSAIGYQIL